jgi:phage terminase large subunit GpA-like protein
MAQQRYYVSCPDCRTRMVRTGKKVKEYRSLYETWVYKREYKCPGCSLVIGYSESRNCFYRSGV